MMYVYTYTYIIYYVYNYTYIDLEKEKWYHLNLSGFEDLVSLLENNPETKELQYISMLVYVLNGKLQSLL